MRHRLRAAGELVVDLINYIGDVDVAIEITVEPIGIT